MVRHDSRPCCNHANWIHLHATGPQTPTRCPGGQPRGTEGVMREEVRGSVREQEGGRDQGENAKLDSFMYSCLKSVFKRHN